MSGKIERKRRRGWQKIRCLDSVTNSVDMNLDKFWEMVKDREAWHAAVHGIAVGHDLVTKHNNMLSRYNPSKAPMVPVAFELTKINGFL